ncbi:unnamed protein product [Soboliphyme baturini]|uniref:Protein-S-isoprenylcysteine O-methyltransferase n=1 Tax=Soboliphyme baturini TaxID=241478 RepID=A0A183IK12_9BILA|nr:unnamed protein product [Soboliphyme baturini]
MDYVIQLHVVEVAIRSSGLGQVCAFGFGLATLHDDELLRSFGQYLIVFSLFHFSEYATTALCNPRFLSIDSFLLNHSIQYWLAAFSCWLEFFTELRLFPGLKMLKLISLFGLILCIVGETIRKLAMVQAGSNFSHLIAFKKEPSHRLITSGIYSIVRHPSYVGWFLWCVGTQVLLVNPICTVIFAVVSWRFFNERIFLEEQTLVAFFGMEYVNYQKKVRCGLPWIEGFKI